MPYSKVDIIGFILLLPLLIAFTLIEITWERWREEGERLEEAGQRFKEMEKWENHLSE